MFICGKDDNEKIIIHLCLGLPNVKTISRTDLKNKSLKLIGSVIIYDDSPEMQEFFWSKKKEGKDFEEIDTNLSEIMTDNPSLTITNVGPDDAGEYQLTAINAVGSSTSDAIILSISFYFRISFPFKKKDISNIYLSSVFTVKCAM